MASQPQVGSSGQPCPEGYTEEQCRKAAKQCIRTIITPDGWKLCKGAREAGRSQLFNLQEDPGEVHNLYYDKANRDKRDSLLGLILEWQESVRDTVAL